MPCETRVSSLASALGSIVHRADASVKSMFTCASVVDGIARMAAYATPSDAVRKLSTAVARIMSRTDASVKSAFACASVVDAVLTMSTNNVRCR